MKKSVKNLQPGDIYFSRRLGSRVEVISVTEAKYATYRVVVKRLSAQTDSFDYTAEIEVEE